MDLQGFLIICGHYGCGKTNLSLNLAVEQARRGKRVTLVDLDIVNPYFRSSDYPTLSERYGIRLIAPKFARSTLDAPALPPELAAALTDGSDRDTTIIDAGGDPVGATVLGRFAPKLAATDYALWYVINRNRPETATPELAASLLREIEQVSRLNASGVVNNTHLMGETTAEMLADSVDYATETARILGLPLVLTAAPSALCGQLMVPNLFPVDIYVRPPW